MNNTKYRERAHREFRQDAKNLASPCVFGFASHRIKLLLLYRQTPECWYDIVRVKLVQCGVQ